MKQKKNVQGKIIEEKKYEYLTNYDDEYDSNRIKNSTYYFSPTCYLFSLFSSFLFEFLIVDKKPMAEAFVCFMTIL